MTVSNSRSNLGDSLPAADSQHGRFSQLAASIYRSVPRAQFSVNQTRRDLDAVAVPDRVRFGGYLNGNGNNSNSKNDTKNNNDSNGSFRPGRCSGWQVYYGAPVSRIANHGGKKVGSAKKGLTLEERQEVREAFELFDVDKRGRINYRQVKVAMRALGFNVRKEEVRSLMSEYCQDDCSPDDQTATLSEFMDMMAVKIGERDPNEEIAKAFRLFDDDNTGKITMKNLRRIVREIGEDISEQELNSMIEEFDKDGDGEISEAEFYEIMRCLGKMAAVQGQAVPGGDATIADAGKRLRQFELPRGNVRLMIVAQTAGPRVTGLQKPRPLSWSSGRGGGSKVAGTLGWREQMPAMLGLRRRRKMVLPRRMHGYYGRGRGPDMYVGLTRSDDMEEVHVKHLLEELKEGPQTTDPATSRPSWPVVSKGGDSSPRPLFSVSSLDENTLPSILKGDAFKEQQDEGEDAQAGEEQKSKAPRSIAATAAVEGVWLTPLTHERMASWWPVDHSKVPLPPDLFSGSTEASLTWQRTDADLLMLETWLNNSLVVKKKPRKDQSSRPPTGLRESSNTVAPLRPSTHGSVGTRPPSTNPNADDPAGEHRDSLLEAPRKGLEEFGLGRAELLKKGLTLRQIERMYRLLFVYSVGQHDMIRELVGAFPQRSKLVSNFWRAYASLCERSLKIQFKSEVAELLEERENALLQLNHLRERLAEAMDRLSLYTLRVTAMEEETRIGESKQRESAAKEEKLRTELGEARAEYEDLMAKYTNVVRHRSMLFAQLHEKNRAIEAMGAEVGLARKERADTARLQREREQNAKRVELLERELHVKAEEAENMRSRAELIRGRLNLALRDIAVRDQRLGEAAADCSRLAGAIKSGNEKILALEKELRAQKMSTTKEEEQRALTEDKLKAVEEEKESLREKLSVARGECQMAMRKLSILVGQREQPQLPLISEALKVSGEERGAGGGGAGGRGREGGVTTGDQPSHPVAAPTEVPAPGGGRWVSEDELKELSAAKERLRSKRDEVKSHIRIVKAELQQVRQMLEEAGKKRDEERERRKEDQATSQRLEKELKEANTELDELRPRLQALDEQLREVEEQLQKEIEEKGIAERLVDALSDEVEKSRQQLQDSEQQVAMLRAEVSALHRSLEDERAFKAWAHDKEERLEAKVKSLESEIGDCKARLQRLGMDNKCKRAEMARMESEMSELVQENTRWKQIADSAKAENKELVEAMARMVEADEKVGAADRRALTSEDPRHALSGDSEADDARQGGSQLRGSSQRDTQREQQVAKEVERLRGEVGQLKDELSKGMAVSEQLRAELTSLQTRIVELEQKEEAASRKIAESEMRIQEATQLKQAAEQALQDVKAQITSAQSEAFGMEVLYKRARKDLSRMKEENQAIVKTLAVADASVKAMEMELEKEIVTRKCLEEEVSKARMREESARRELRDARQDLEAFKRWRTQSEVELEKERSAHHVEVMELREMVEGLKAEVVVKKDALRAKWRDRIQELERHKAEAEARVKLLESAIENSVMEPIRSA
ncbi:hypothetical protein CBR_g54309 [Chara braunii]|uniref:EF-hand domain-containing protein n=1 Tax=Chara braunii TaxID=69332 RepID=A0A388MBV9_CHABU|nr:hypothetical protein CBR_g54309 [Chara braunii]|eukprot:GBG92054.1 hypothetical protein CBR_g54309 [Chara braunii]